MIKIGVIGCGYWGPNYIRVFSELSASYVSVFCDINANKLEHIKRIYPSIKQTKKYMDVLRDPKIDAVCISTPASTHYEIARDSLLHGKHVLVEKPFVLDIKEGKDLVKIAKNEKRILMVGHVYLYHPVIQKIREYICNNELGSLYCLHSTRTGLGPIRRDVNAMWDLAPHDISIFLYLLDNMPLNVSARGASYLQEGIEDVVFTTLEFPEKILCNVHTSWLDPYKIRNLTLVGSRKMLVFNETDPYEKVKILNKGASVKESHESFGDFLFQVRTGDIYIPRIEFSEPLKNQCQHFLECIYKDKQPLTDGKEGLRVIKVLEAAHLSLRNNGASVEVEP